MYSLDGARSVVAQVSTEVGVDDANRNQCCEEALTSSKCSEEPRWKPKPSECESGVLLSD